MCWIVVLFIIPCISDLLSLLLKIFGDVFIFSNFLKTLTSAHIIKALVKLKLLINRKSWIKVNQFMTDFSIKHSDKSISVYRLVVWLDYKVSQTYS